MAKTAEGTMVAAARAAENNGDASNPNSKWIQARAKPTRIAPPTHDMNGDQKDPSYITVQFLVKNEPGVHSDGAKLLKRLQRILASGDRCMIQVEAEQADLFDE